MRNIAEYWCLHLLKLFFNSVFDLNWCHWYWKFVWDYIFVVIENLPQFFLSFSEMLQWHSLWLYSLRGSSMYVPSFTEKYCLVTVLFWLQLRMHKALVCFLTFSSQFMWWSCRVLTRQLVPSYFILSSIFLSCFPYGFQPSLD